MAKKRSKKSEPEVLEPTQKEVEQGVAEMAGMVDDSRDKATFLHGKVKAGFALIGLVVAIRKSGGSVEAALTAIDALHDDWVVQAMEAIAAYEKLTGDCFNAPCNECGGPTCEEHEEVDADVHSCVDGGDHE